MSTTTTTGTAPQTPKQPEVVCTKNGHEYCRYPSSAHPDWISCRFCGAMWSEETTSACSKTSGFYGDVFREEINADGKRHGMVGFTRKDGKDYLRLVSWADGEQVAIDFEASAALPLSELIRHAAETKNRPDENSCFSFPEYRGAVYVERAPVPESMADDIALLESAGFAPPVGTDTFVTMRKEEYERLIASVHEERAARDAENEALLAELARTSCELKEANREYATAATSLVQRKCSEYSQHFAAEAGGAIMHLEQQRDTLLAEVEQLRGQVAAMRETVELVANIPINALDNNESARVATGITTGTICRARQALATVGQGGGGNDG